MFCLSTSLIWFLFLFGPLILQLVQNRSLISLIRTFYQSSFNTSNTSFLSWYFFNIQMIQLSWFYPLVTSFTFYEFFGICLLKRLPFLFLLWFLLFHLTLIKSFLFLNWTVFKFSLKLWFRYDLNIFFWLILEKWKF